MKKRSVNQLAFNKHTVIELNDAHLAEINGGTVNTTHACAVVAISALSVGSMVVTLAFEFGLLEGAADAIATK